MARSGEDRTPNRRCEQEFRPENPGIFGFLPMGVAKQRLAFELRQNDSAAAFELHANARRARKCSCRDFTTAGQARLGGGHWRARSDPGGTLLLRKIVQTRLNQPFGLSPSKPCPPLEEEQPFDRLRANGKCSLSPVQAGIGSRSSATAAAPSSSPSIQASRSGLITSACVVHMPCGKPS